MTNYFENIYIEDDEGYFFSYEHDGLYRLNLKNWQCGFLTSYGKMDNERLFSNVVKYNEWLILIPMQADEFMVYNIHTKEKKFLEIPAIAGNYKRSAKLLAAHLVGDTLYVVGHSYPGIIKIDLLKWKVLLLIDLSQQYGALRDGKDAFRYSKCYNGKIIIPSACENRVLILDINSDQYKFEEINVSTSGFASVFMYKDNFVFVPLYEKKLVLWDPNNKSTKLIEIKDNVIRNDVNELVYSNAVTLRGYEIIDPMWMNPIVVFDKSTHEVKIIEIDKITNGYEKNIKPIRSCFVYHSRIYAVSANNGEIFEIDMEKLELKSIGHRLTARYENNGQHMGKRVFKESNGYLLRDYLIDMTGCTYNK